jgi:signal transduction histidine kinase
MPHRNDWYAGEVAVRIAKPQAVDAAIAAVFFAAIAVDKLHGPSLDTAHTLASGGLTLVLTGALVVRRRFPLTAFIAGAAVVAAESVLGVPSGVTPFGGQVLVYSAGLYATRARSWGAPPLIVLGVVVYFSSRPDAWLVEAVGVLFTWLATWAVGYTTARRREEQVRSRLAIRRQVIAEEQTRMARELHDLIGHTVNLLVVQAGAARVKLDTDPATTRALLTAMEQTGRDALTDLDHVLGLLRSDASPSHRPEPGLAGLPELVSRLSDSQVTVRLSVDPEPTLPRPLDLTAYRIVQEALTNVLKHAAPCSAEVAVRRDAEMLLIDVSDDGRPVARLRPGGGRGLIGIAERVSACGGSVDYGPRPSGGFAVHAALPLP